MKIKNNLYSTNYLLLFLFIIISITIYFLNIQTINTFRDEARNQVKFLAKKYTEAINNSDSNEIRFILDIMLPSLNFPIIIKTNNEIYSTMNIISPYIEGTSEHIKYINELALEMDKFYKPLNVYSNNMKIHQIHFGDPRIINKLIWLPYLEIIFFIFFILIAFMGFQLIRKDEKNLIYAGMARETAHQLGTPISSLMGWVKLLEEGEDDEKKIIKYIYQDLDRLSIISDRFSKIGSIPQMGKINISNLLINASNYIKIRAPKSIKFKINSHTSEDITGDITLLDWAFQNIIKNSVDAISNNNDGQISINIDKYFDQHVLIDIEDNGIGIPRRHRKNIFKPGFSSKKRGWGLGLSLTKRIIQEIHLGKIWIFHSTHGKTIIRTILKY